MVEPSLFEKLKEIIFGCCAIALAIIVLVNLLLIWVFDRVYIYEENLGILIAEIVLVAVILVLGLERFGRDLIVRTFISKR